MDALTFFLTILPPLLIERPLSDETACGALVGACWLCALNTPSCTSFTKLPVFKIVAECGTNTAQTPPPEPRFRCNGCRHRIEDRTQLYWRCVYSSRLARYHQTQNAMAGNDAELRKQLTRYGAHWPTSNDSDDKLYVSPALMHWFTLQSSDTVELVRAVFGRNNQPLARFKKNLNEVFRLLECIDSANDEVVTRRLTFPEIPGTMLGLSKSKGHGYGLCGKRTEWLFKHLKELMVVLRTDSNFSPSNTAGVFFASTTLYCKGVAADAISDMCIFMMFPEILNYTDALTRRIPQLTKISREYDLKDVFRIVADSQRNAPSHQARKEAEYWDTMNFAQLHFTEFTNNIWRLPTIDNELRFLVPRIFLARIPYFIHGHAIATIKMLDINLRQSQPAGYADAQQVRQRSSLPFAEMLGLAASQYCDSDLFAAKYDVVIFVPSARDIELYKDTLLHELGIEDVRVTHLKEAATALLRHGRRYLITTARTIHVSMIFPRQTAAIRYANISPVLSCFVVATCSRAPGVR